MDYILEVWFSSGKTISIPGVPPEIRADIVANFMNPPYHSAAFTFPDGRELYLSLDKIEYFTITARDS